jgi:DNA-binding NtrC family response regulator
MAVIRVLIAEDEKNLRSVLRRELTADGYDAEEAEEGGKALELLQREEFDVLLLDLNMPGVGGLDVLKKMRELQVPAEVIVLTANLTVSTAVEAMKLGAYDYLTKPFKIDELSLVIEKAYEKKKLRSENLLLKSQIKRQSEATPLIAASPAMRELLEAVKKVAGADIPVLITGESGSGKELVARELHRNSARSENSFVAINCAAIPETMIESEIFGFEKGAFSGAHARKPGLLEIAHHGTFFLDEIGDMPAALQVKLLRVIETGTFFRLGGTGERKVEVRVVSATNKDLRAETAGGRFREDLYYRIGALTFRVPPLRERPEDIPLMVEHFSRNNAAFGKKSFSAGAMKALIRYPWPGNVRELQNVVQRALLLAKGEVIEEEDLPSDVGECRKIESRRLEDIEREHILNVLRESGGHRGKAAEILGIDPKTLYRKIAHYETE